MNRIHHTFGQVENEFDDDRNDHDDCDCDGVVRVRDVLRTEPPLCSVSTSGHTTHAIQLQSDLPICIQIKRVWQ